MTEKIAATHEEAAKIEELMKAPFPVTLATVAKALNTTELASAQKMPDDAVAFVTGSIAERFEALWAELASWQKVTLFIVHAGHVFEIQTKLSTGKCARGYYNILQKDAVAGGHIKYEDIAAAHLSQCPLWDENRIPCSSSPMTDPWRFLSMSDAKTISLSIVLSKPFIRPRPLSALVPD